jgi:hypothetical protein
MTQELLNMLQVTDKDLLQQLVIRFYCENYDKKQDINADTNYYDSNLNQLSVLINTPSNILYKDKEQSTYTYAGYDPILEGGLIHTAMFNMRTRTIVPYIEIVGVDNEEVFEVGEEVIVVDVDETHYVSTIEEIVETIKNNSIVLTGRELKADAFRRLFKTLDNETQQSLIPHILYLVKTLHHKYRVKGFEALVNTRELIKIRRL